MFGTIEEIELVPNGKNIEVTNENKKDYIYKKLHFYLAKQIEVQTKAFLTGFTEIFDLDLLQSILNENDLQYLLAGELKFDGLFF